MCTHINSSEPRKSGKAMKNPVAKLDNGINSGLTRVLHLIPLRDLFGKSLKNKYPCVGQVGRARHVSSCQAISRAQDPLARNTGAGGKLIRIWSSS